MSDANHSAPSIRRGLLLVLGAVIFVATIVQATLAYRVALDEVDDIADYQMTQIAHALRHRMPDAVSSAPVASVGSDKLGDKDDKTTFRIEVRPFVAVATDSSQLQRTRPGGFSDETDAGHRYRVFTLHTKNTEIIVMHDLALRRQRARALALRTISPILVLAPVLLLCVWWGISRALRPIARFGTEIARRDINDLTPLCSNAVPQELLPFFAEINVLFSRINKAFAAQQNFVADAAHELRSPLTALRLQTQILERATSEEARASAVRRLLEGIDRAAHLVDQMLVLAREEASVGETARTDLPTVARLAMSDINPLARARGIHFTARVPDNENEYSISGNIEALRIMLRNLLQNAVKYAPENGHVTLDIARARGCLQLSVEDDGPGIPIEDRERLFKRFNRGHNPQIKGSGLGLAIVEAIATRHRIRIELSDSIELGGLCVRLYFPDA